MAEQVFRKSQGYPDRRIMHPKREWGIGVLLFVGIVVLGSVVAGKVFVLYGEVAVIDGNSGGSIPKYKEVIVQDALEKHRARAKQYEVLQGKDVPVVVTEPLIETEGGNTIPSEEAGLESF